jgi:hypothetical protein
MNKGGRGTGYKNLFVENHVYFTIGDVDDALRLIQLELSCHVSCAGILQQSMGARNRVRIGL